MGRSARFSGSEFIRAAQQIMADEGVAGLTVQKIAARTGATTGSVYHRFDSLDSIAAVAWLDAAENFQSEFSRSLDRETLFESVASGALHTPVWARANLTRARVLLRLSVAGLRAASLSEELQRRARALERHLRRQSLALVGRFGGRARARQLPLLRFLLADMPLAAVKPHLTSNRRPTPQADEIIRTTVLAFKEELR